MKHPGLWLLGGTVLILATSCQASTHVSTLWTNVPEVAGYVEKFNGEQKQWQILVEYQAHPARQLLATGPKADLVIASGLNSKEVRSTLTSMSFLFERGGITKAQFYPSLLASGSDGDTPLLIPLSFDLPILVFRRGALENPDGLILSFSAVQHDSKSFNTSAPPGFNRFAFSPRWESFALSALEAEGVSFGEDFRNRLAWDQERLSAGVHNLQTWIQGLDPAQEKDFTRKYQESNPLQMLQEGRELFTASSLKSFLSLPTYERQGLEFRYPDNGHGIPALDDIVWAGIPSSAVTRAAAQAFLTWYFQEKTQKELVAETHTQDTRGFGLATGLDSLVKVNEDILPQAYPELTGRVPPPALITFPPVRPLEWNELKKKVLTPWLNQQLLGEQKAQLSDEVERWYRESAPQ